MDEPRPTLNYERRDPRFEPPRRSACAMSAVVVVALGVLWMAVIVLSLLRDGILARAPWLDVLPCLIVILPGMTVGGWVLIVLIRGPSGSLNRRRRDLWPVSDDTRPE
jgi:hypothetical protein